LSGGARGHIVQAAYQLAVLDQERNFVGSDFEHGAGSFDVAGAVAEAGIEKAGVVNAELAISGSKGTISAANSGGTRTLSRDARM
jgi:hypothetical protein